MIRVHENGTVRAHRRAVVERVRTLEELVRDGTITEAELETGWP